MHELKKKLFAAQKAEADARKGHDSAREELEKVKSEIKNHPQMPMGCAEHAIIQFMQRALKIDLQPHITQMLNLCDDAKECDEQNRSDGMQYVYKTAGPNNTMLTMIVKNNTIVTCYVNEVDNPPLKDNGK